MKLTITVQSGSQAGRSLDLTEGFLTIGRGGNCNLLFDPNAENMVSTKHAYIETKPDGFYLVDTKSTNGTFVNGNTVQIIKLNSGDSIQFGKNGPIAVVVIEMPNFQNDPTIQASFPQNQAANWGTQQPQFSQPLPSAPNFQNSVSYIGVSSSAIKVEEPKSNAGKIIGGVVAAAIFALLGLLSVGIIASGVGLVAACIATFLAFIPSILYILPLIFLDRYDPEPPWLIASAFAWGGCVATFVSIIVNSLVGIVALNVSGDKLIGDLSTTVLSAPIVEEFSKGVGVVLIFLIFRKEFDDILDGIVYGGVVGLGFATVENILYYGQGVVDGSLILTLIVRGIMSPFCHSTFTAMTGIGCGIARESHNKAVRIIMPIVGYIGAVLLHMIWNGGLGFLSQVFLGGLGFFISYAILAVPFFLVFIGFCIWTMRRQNRILREMLAMDTARGLISQEQMDTATSVFKSTPWLLGGILGGKLLPRWRFLRAVGKLGLSYWHIQRATAAQGQTGSFQTNPVFRAEVEKWRDKV